MLWRASDLTGYGLAATDGSIGLVKDLLFDDRDWTVRWVVADTGSWLPGRKVLLPPTAFGEADPISRHIPVDLTRERIKQSPGIEVDQPVSRQIESDIYGYYGWSPYWAGAYGIDPYYTPASGREEPSGDPALRSAQEVIGYYIEASDGSIGHVEDILIDTDSWATRYLLIDTRNWWPGKMVLISPRWATEIRWSESKVHVAVSREKVKGSPEYDPTSPVDRGYEQRLHEYYEHRPYWGI